MSRFNPAYDLFPHGTTCFVAVSAGLVFCAHDAHDSNWVHTTGILPSWDTAGGDALIHVPYDGSVIYLGPDNTKPKMTFKDRRSNGRDSGPYHAHSFLTQGKLVIRWVPYNRRQVRPHGSFRGLFYLADEDTEISAQIPAG